MYASEMPVNSKVQCLVCNNVIYIYIYIYIYIIWECYRTQNISYTYNESINDDKTTLFTHPPRVSLARFTLLETSQLISDDVTMT